MRRACRRPIRGGQAVPSALSRVLAALAGGSVFTARNYASSGGKVTDFIDHLDATHSLTQGTDANRVLAPTTDPSLRNAPSSSFSVGKTYASTRAASTWKRLHDGTGGGVCLIWVPETVPAGTANCYMVQTTNTTPRGGCLLNAVFVTGPVYRTQYAVYTPTVKILDTVYSTNAFAAGVGNSMRTRYLEGGGSPEGQQFLLGTQVQTADSTGAPDSGNPSVTLTLGGTTVESTWTWRFHALFVPPGDWTAAQVTAVSNYAKTLGLAGA